MTNIKKSKYKISRRVGGSLWGHPKDAFLKKNYRPGHHGRGLIRKTSDFKKQCVAQRMFKGYYLMNEKQFKRFFYVAYKKKGNTNNNLVGMLESRLSAVLYNSALVPTMFAARQVVSHKHVMVNGAIVNIASYLVKPGDVITIRDRFKDKILVLQSVQDKIRSVPSYLEIDTDRREIKFIRVPSFSEVPYPMVMNPGLVVEFYSR